MDHLHKEDIDAHSKTESLLQYEHTLSDITRQMHAVASKLSAHEKQNNINVNLFRSGLLMARC